MVVAAIVNPTMLVVFPPSIVTVIPVMPVGRLCDLDLAEAVDADLDVPVAEIKTRRGDHFLGAHKEPWLNLVHLDLMLSIEQVGDVQVGARTEVLATVNDDFVPLC